MLMDLTIQQEEEEALPEEEEKEGKEEKEEKEEHLIAQQQQGCWRGESGKVVAEVQQVLIPGWELYMQEQLQGSRPECQSRRGRRRGKLQCGKHPSTLPHCLVV
jgi:hypothetical protein